MQNKTRRANRQLMAARLLTRGWVENTSTTDLVFEGLYAEIELKLDADRSSLAFLWIDGRTWPSWGAELAVDFDGSFERLLDVLVEMEHRVAADNYKLFIARIMSICRRTYLNDEDRGLVPLSNEGFHQLGG